MKFRETSLPGVWLIDLDRIEDERGFFARSWCQQTFAERGLNSRLIQCNISWNERAGTIRGLHYQKAPHGEAKVVRCTRGAIFDVAADLRPESPTFRRWFGTELTADNRRMLYIPEGLAHGFQSLQDQTEVFYQMSEAYHPAHAAGARWDDPAFQIAWPLAHAFVSKRDAEFPLLAP